MRVNNPEEQYILGCIIIVGITIIVGILLHKLIKKITIR